MSLAQELLYALRYVGKNRRLFIAVGGQLAAGVAACIVLAGLVDGLLWGDLPYRGPERLIYLFESRPGQSRDQGVPVSIPTFEDWLDSSTTLEGIARVPMVSAPSVMLSGTPERVQGYGVTSNLLQLLGVSPLMGRPFAADEELPGGNGRVLLLSHDFWNRRMKADPEAVGKRIRLEGGEYVIVGVMPQSFTYPFYTAGRYKADFWVPAVATPEEYASRTERRQLVIGRLKRGVSMETARREMQEITSRIGIEHQATNGGWGVRISPIQRRFVERSNSREALFLSGLAVSGVLLLACANVVGLLSANAVKRRPEMAVMMALGAGKHVILRRLLAEGVLVALLSTVGALVLAWAGLYYVERLIPAHVPRVRDISVQSAVTGLGVALGVCTSLVCSAMPLLTFAGLGPSETLRESTVLSGRFENRFGTLVVLLHTALVTLLLALSLTAITRFNGLLAASAESISIDSVVSAQLQSSAELASDRSLRQFHGDVLSRIQALPGVESAALVSELPLSARRFRRAVPVTRRDSDEDEEADVDARLLIVSPEYFRTVGIRLLRGRALNSRDTSESDHVAIISRSLASQLELEQRFSEKIRVRGREWLEVVGVVADAPLEFGRSDPILYVPAAQFGTQTPNRFQEYLLMTREGAMVVKTSLPARAIAPAIRKAVWSGNESVPVTVQAMTGVVAESTASERLIVLVFACLALVAAILAGAGIYAVLAFYGSRRTAEIGLRKCLGARSSQVVWPMILRVMRISVIGVMFGTLVTVVMQKLLFSAVGITHLVSSVEYLASGTIALAVALVASIGPAYQAARQDPTAALRHA